MNLQTLRQMIDHFEQRTQHHRALFVKYYSLIKGGVIANNQVIVEHDLSKFSGAELLPYIFLTWKYKQHKDGNVDFRLPTNIEREIQEATFVHVLNNRHHPEFWDGKVTMEHLNQLNRDAPSGRIVDATQMTGECIEEMCADWMAVAEERGTNPFDWAKTNINVRWKFTPEQEKQIYKTLEDVWVK